MENTLLDFTISNYRVFDKPHRFVFKPITFLVGPNNSGKSSVMKYLSFLKENIADSDFSASIKITDSKYFFNSKSMIQEAGSLILKANVTNAKPCIIPNVSFELKYPLGLWTDENVGEYGSNYFSKISGLDFKYKNSFINIVIYDDYFKIHGISLNDIIDSVRNKIQQLRQTNYRDLSFDLYGERTFDKWEEWEMLIFTYFYSLNKQDKIDLWEDSNINLSLFELKRSVDDDSFFMPDIESEIIADIQNVFPKEATFHGFYFRYKSILETESISRLKADIIELIGASLQKEFKSRIHNLLGGNFIIQTTPFYLLLFRLLSEEIFSATNNIAGIFYSLYDVPIDKYPKNYIINLSSPETFLEKAVKQYFLLKETEREGVRTHSNWFNEGEDPWWVQDIEKWIQYFGICDKIEIEAPFDDFYAARINLIDNFGNRICLKDMGSGANQIVSLLFLPFLQGLGRKSSLFYLEEPESNLHPSWQSKLLELIVELKNKCGINFIIETHSEYMIRKMQNIIAADKDPECKNRKDCQIYYFRSNEDYEKDTDPNKLKAYEINIDDKGKMSHEFGPGFTDEALNLEFDLIKIRKYQQN